MTAPEQIDLFIERWSGRIGGQERANYALFLSELCATLDLPAPDPADADTAANDYVFERAVVETLRNGAKSHRRIDLYKRDCFVLEAKQSRQFGAKALPNHSGVPSAEPKVLGRRTADRRWDDLMLNARQQAEGYVRWLPKDHTPPPFILVCDVGHCFEVYANFRRDGKAYDQFPDRQSFRIYLEELRQPAIQERFRAIWSDPMALDPARRSARVTRDIATRLATVSKALEDSCLPTEDVALFLMRCLFTMFAEDSGLLPHKSFQKLLARCEDAPEKLEPLVGQLWEAMNDGGFAMALETRVKRFNGQFFKSRTVLPLSKEAIAELRQAATHDWRDVDPSIFGTLLEQALDPNDRRNLGAHYTPRVYVERLVIATVIEPLRRDWAAALSTAQRQKMEGRPADAVKTVQGFHRKLCDLRVLDPACGTGNFLYVSLELMKRLEGEVLEALTDLGGQEVLAGFEGLTVDPHQFLGLELNTRAAAIAELVLWIGFLQWHIRTQTSMPSEPILKAFKNIQVMNAVLSGEKTLVRDDQGRPITKLLPDGSPREVYRYTNPRRPDWPSADFIVGNPPFIGGKDLRSRLGDEEAEALWAAHPKMNDSADLVMYWWDHAAELLTRRNTRLRRFGLVTTNSISQVFQRRTIERHCSAKKPISLVMAIPDHPWTKATPDAAAVRIAMTVAERGSHDGVLREVIREEALETDEPRITLKDRQGRIHSDLTVGPDVTTARALLANEGLCSPGVKLHGSGFIVTPDQAKGLGLGRRPGLEQHIRHYRNAWRYGD
ncbi:MAG: class I SAM-dependent DNA methyltransferase [Alphaproteobacteria bacterium]|nr:MAG: class I SAM-dependent DNA methyltransferase [Alphaproteobacteria bacterium]